MTTESDFSATSQKLDTLITGIHKKTVMESARAQLLPKLAGERLQVC